MREHEIDANAVVEFDVIDEVFAVISPIVEDETDDETAKEMVADFARHRYARPPDL